MELQEKSGMNLLCANCHRMEHERLRQANYGN